MNVLCDFQWQADKICSKDTPDWKVPVGDAPVTLRSVSMGAVQEASEIDILLTLVITQLSAVADLYPIVVPSVTSYPGTGTLIRPKN